jgi:hypothetical protein
MITNLIRPNRTGEPASERQNLDPENREGKTQRKGRPDDLRGNVQKRRVETVGWLETVGSEVQVRKAGRPVRNREGVHVAEATEEPAVQESERP